MSTVPASVPEAADAWHFCPSPKRLSAFWKARPLLNPKTSICSTRAAAHLRPLLLRKLDNPPFDASAMDGYAVRAEDVATIPASLNVIGEAGAGRPFTGALGSGEAVRIFTGGRVPEGADAIVIQENVTASGSSITVQETAARGANIRPQGQDFAKDEVLIEPGRLLTARDVLIAASSGHAKLAVTQKACRRHSFDRR